MYKAIRPLLYTMAPERAHYFAAGLLESAAAVPMMAELLRKWYTIQHNQLEREVFGLKFPNPVGLAAGFDKDARWIEALECLGFGFVEIGTLTPKAQPGNEPPRLFRLEQDEALINRMGFNNQGVAAALERIKNSHHNNPLGGNIGKNKVTPNEEAVNDYRFSYERLYDHVDYFVVNVSSPNTPGLRALQGKEELKKIFDALFVYRSEQGVHRPTLLKIAPDLNQFQLEEIVSLVKEMGIDGVIATNTTLDRSGLNNEPNAQEAGGLSGKPVRKKSTEVIRFIHQASDGSIPIIGVGGIHDPASAMEKLEAGASLVQVYTGFIYEGPSLVKRINKALIK